MSRTIRHRAHGSAPAPSAAPARPSGPALPPVEPHDAAAANGFARRLREALAYALLHAGDDAGADPTPLTVPRAWSAVGPGQLASGHPGSAVDRLPARALYERCLQHYRSVVRPEDLARGVDDLGAALARFVAANMEALHGIRAPRGVLKRLERQLVGIVRRSPAWAAAGVHERQSTFEQAALLSVLIGDCAAQAPQQGEAAVANVRHAARGYLIQLIGIDPGLLTLGPDGLTLAPDPEVADAASMAWHVAERVAEPA